MKNLRSKSKSKSRSQSSKRQELEISLPLVTVISIGLVCAFYALLYPIKKSYLGILLYERGPTQHLAMLLAAMVVTITVLKLLTLQPEYGALGKIWIAEHIPIEQADSPEVSYLQERLMSDGSLVAKRCGRILAAYINSGDRATATECALDDSSFYQSASESSYSVPRILVWAIPLLGFIGTVVGISQAVNGFSGFLEEAGDVEQIKEGIGTVTSGLAVAFDTTLLALFLSVLVMIPLVLVERYESRLLLGIDIFINDKLLPRLKEKNQSISEESINKAIKNAIDGHFPNPEKLIEPAHNYAEQAANSLARGFIAEISKVQDVSSQVINQVEEVRDLAERDRQKFMDFFVQQQQVNQETVAKIQELVTDIKAKNGQIGDELNLQTQQISFQLEQAAKVLENKVSSLEQSARKISNLQSWQASLDESLRSLEKTAQLAQILEGVKDNLGQLKPILSKLNKPRTITLVEQDNHSGK
jgi:biopolymer transport protein ExbB/TolQ/exonuclease VII small subunit